MTPSVEYRALLALRKPLHTRPGDMWLCRRMGIVRVFNAHKRGSRKGVSHNSFHLYHWQRPSLMARGCDWRDDDPNACVTDPLLSRDGERWEYLGNIFDLLPYAMLAREAEPLSEDS